MYRNEKSSYKPRASTGNPRRMRVVMLIKTYIKITILNQISCTYIPRIEHIARKRLSLKNLFIVKS